MREQLFRCALILQLAFVLSRSVFYYFGVSFDATPLHYFLQYIDTELLQTRLLESVFYLHSQPPLFNLFLGIMLKCFPGHFIQAASVVYLLLGQLFMFGLFALMVRLKVRPWIACALTALYMISPSVIMYENLLFYEYPAAVLLVWAGLWLHLFVEKRTIFHGFMFFLTLAVLGLLKSIFHFFWMLLIIVVLWRALRLSLKKALAIAGIPLVLLGGVYTKNLVVFGDFAVSYFLMSDNIFNMAVSAVTHEKIYEYYQEGKISAQTAIAVLEVGEHFSWEEVQSIITERVNKLGKTGVPLLDNLYTESNKRESIHSLLTLIDHHEFMKDSIFLLKQDMKSYYLSLGRVFILYFFPGPTDNTIHNRKYISGYEDNFNFMFKHLNQLNGGELYTKYLHMWFVFYRMRWDELAIILYSSTVTFYVLLFMYGVKRAVIAMKNKPIFNPDSLTLIFITFNILFVGVISILLSWWATNRYRFNIESFFWVLFALFLTHAIQRVAGYLKKLPAKTLTC